MNFKTTKKNIEELGLEVLALCPVDQTEDFVDGYIEYVSIFIEAVKSFYGHVENLDGSCYVDIEYTCETTNKLIQLEALLQPLLNKNEYFAGSLRAQVNTLDAFIGEFGIKKRKAA